MYQILGLRTISSCLFRSRLNETKHVERVPRQTGEDTTGEGTTGEEDTNILPLSKNYFNEKFVLFKSLERSKHVDERVLRQTFSSSSSSFFFFSSSSFVFNRASKGTIQNKYQ